MTAGRLRLDTVLPETLKSISQLVPSVGSASNSMPRDAVFIASDATCLLKFTNTSADARSVVLLTKRTRARDEGGGRLLSLSTSDCSAPRGPVRTIDESVAGRSVGIKVSSVAPGVAVDSTVMVGLPV